MWLFPDDRDSSVLGFVCGFWRCMIKVMGDGGKGNPNPGRESDPHRDAHHPFLPSAPLTPAHLPPSSDSNCYWERRLLLLSSNTGKELVSHPHLHGDEGKGMRKMVSNFGAVMLTAKCAEKRYEFALAQRIITARVGPYLTFHSRALTALANKSCNDICCLVTYNYANGIN